MILQNKELCVCSLTLVAKVNVYIVAELCVRVYGMIGTVGNRTCLDVRGCVWLWRMCMRGCSFCWFRHSNCHRRE